MSKRILLFLIIILSAAFLLAGCGDDGSDGAPGSDADASALIAALQAQLDAGLITIAQYEEAIAALQAQANTPKITQGESCATCHNGDVQFDGDAHQTVFDNYQDVSKDKAGNTYAVTTVAPVSNAGGTVTLYYTVTKNSTALTTVAQLNSEFSSKMFIATGYDDGTGYLLTGDHANASVTTTYDAVNARFQTVLTPLSGNPLATSVNGVAAVVLSKDALKPKDANLNLYDVTVATGGTYGTVNFVSSANEEGCAKCHGAPYMKHSFWPAGAVKDGSGNDIQLLLCHSCHKGGGGAATLSHATQGFQLLYDNPARYAELNKLSGGVLANMTAAEKTKYDTDRTLMNDVHMSHNMEFAYPQSMKNCVTCHEGKLNRILANTNFVMATCQSCHAIDNLNAKAKAKYASHPTLSAASAACYTGCHQDNSGIELNTIHKGYDAAVYANSTTKYADGVKMTINSATLSGSSLTINFSAASTIAGVNASSIVPSVYIGGYGYDTKDFVVSYHSQQSNALSVSEYTFGGAANANFTNPTKTGSSWSVTYNINALDATGLITKGVIKRIEIAVASNLNVNGVQAVITTPSKTFNLKDGAFENFYTDIVKFDESGKGCVSCHDQFIIHNNYRIYVAGNVTACRMCHSPNSGSGHYEMQSRSFDSYIHAIHSFQAKDTSGIDWNDDVESLEYDHHIESTYPMFSITNCESCHKAGTYNVPDQSKSMPGMLSAAATWTKDRNIGVVPAYDSGPASRACGSCHRAEYINEDEAGDLANLNAHIASFGYLVKDASGVLDSITETIMAMFK